MLDCDEDLGKKSTRRRRYWDAFGSLGLSATLFDAFWAANEEAPEVPLQDIEPLLDDIRTAATLLVGCPSESSGRMMMALVNHADPHKQISQGYAIAPAIVPPGLATAIRRT